MITRGGIVATRPAVTSPVARRDAILAVVVVALGVVSLALYLLALVRPYFLPRDAPFPLLDLGKIGGYDRGAGVRYTAPLVAIWCAYFAAGALAPALRSARLLRWLAYGGAALFALALLWLYPITAADLFNYALYGLVQHHGANPLLAPPQDVIGQPLLGYSAWPAYVSPYGPLWQWIAYGVTALTGERLLAGLLAFKAVLIACHLLNVLLVERIAAGMGWRSPGAAALFYGWNPLVVYETAGNGHNDIVMLTALLLAVWCLGRSPRTRALALPVAALGALAKYVAVIWLPVFVFSQAARLRPRAWLRWCVGAGLACVLLAAAAYWPFWAGVHTFDGIRRQADLTTSSFGSLAMIVMVQQHHLLDAKLALKLVKAAAFAIVALTMLLRRPRDGTAASAVAALFDTTLAYLLVGALWFQPWYLVPLMGLAALSGPARRVLALVYALGAFGSYVVYFYVWPALNWTPDWLLIQKLAVLTAHGPVVVLLAGLAFACAVQRLHLTRD
jgi:hypothetical protein